jgi:hypothetical protein
LDCMLYLNAQVYTASMKCSHGHKPYRTTSLVYCVLIGYLAFIFFFQKNKITSHECSWMACLAPWFSLTCYKFKPNLVLLSVTCNPCCKPERRKGLGPRCTHSNRQIYIFSWFTRNLVGIYIFS